MYFLTGIQMIALLVPVLIAFLYDPSKLQSLTKYQRQLHEQSLQWLIKIGPKYPHEFKKIMCESNELRQRLEISIRHKQQSKILDTNLCMESFTDISEPDKFNQKPTITLKTDFSNFN